MTIHTAIYVTNTVSYFACGLPGKGSSVASDTRTRSKAGDGDRERVLVVDDEDLIADSVAAILNRNGYSATARYSAKAAIQFVEAECPDIIVCDVIMPDSNGVQLAKAIRQHCPDVRVLLFSGNAATSDLLHRASKEGDLFEVLAKPVHPLQLLKALKS
jgi:CheY-like chemotaxis protein